MDDYFDKQKNEEEVLKKYLEAVSLGETEQNNFKHMIGSCKKIQRSLARKEYAQDWILRLLKAFSMYAVNNPSYRNEANDDLKFVLA